MNPEIKILLLEHDEHDLALLLNELKRSSLNFTYHVAGNKVQYENELRSFRPDIILSDYSLPSYDAVTAFEEKEKQCPEIPFIIVSGTVGEEKAVELIKKGVTDYAIKDKLLTLPGKIFRALEESKQKQERILTERELKESQQRLAEAQLIARIGNWEMDLRDKTTFWSEEIYNILGLDPKEMPASKETFLSFIHPDQREEIREKLQDAEQQYASFSYSTRILRRDGTIRYVYSNGKFITSPQGDPLRQVGILQDITETKRMEEELKMLNKELETFIYRASHDLRGPLSSIIGLTNVSKSEITDEASKKYFQMVEQSAQKLDATLISLVQSMTMRDMVIHNEQVDLEELISETLSQLKFHDGYSKIRISVENNSAKYVISNKLILASVFQNLIQNAIKYQNYNHGKAFLKISITKKGDGTQIIFEDNGIGIDDHLQDKIFDMYFRGTSSVTGSGLGLYIVKIGIEKLKGTISLRSVRGDGTQFIIFLPDGK